jgi:hypothetical protein
MESWEALEKAIPRANSEKVARLMNVVPDLVRKWRREPESDEAPTATGQRSPLDRIQDLIDAIYLTNPPGAGLIVNHVLSHHQNLLDIHAVSIRSEKAKAESISHLLTQFTEAINRLNLEGCTDETLRELIEARDAAADVIIRVQKTMMEGEDNA